MTPAPILLGVWCRWCGAQRIETPWDTRDGFHCANCGATNWPPLLQKAPTDDLSPRSMARALDAAMKCKHKGCITELSKSNPGEHCFVHTLDMTQTLRPAKHVRESSRMSKRFLNNLPGVYVISTDDMKSWPKEGGRLTAKPAARWPRQVAANHLKEA